ncbi:hypothetical protein QCA50_004691 [Cerrena zonata]|uniref:Uncharacterized protein n=1 Tax=Cerrena zonata TaxID=2478898 RepID=A0AAW0GFD4_9APHY
MCGIECFGNYHRKCQHYVKLYESGFINDCGSKRCGVSTCHGHAATDKMCQCPKLYVEDRKVLNLIQDRCEDCKKAAWASLGIEERW